MIYSTFKTRLVPVFLAILRISIGWQFLYEGLIKVLNPAWSANPIENREDFTIIKGSSPDHDKHHDNMWDMFPLQTIEFMKEVNKPWIAFKVLAAGAIQPKDGFRYAFENGADFIAVGMFDFQVVDNVNTATSILGDLKNRERKWFS